MFDLIPFAGARRQVTHDHFKPGFISQSLQLRFPEASAHAIAAHAIAAPAVGHDKQLVRLWIGRRAHLVPPRPYGLDGKHRRIMIDPDTDPTRVPGHIIDAIGDRLRFQAPPCRVLPVFAFFRRIRGKSVKNTRNLRS